MNLKNLWLCFQSLEIVFLLIVLILPLSGCVVVHSEGSTPSKQAVKKLSDLNGEYANLSEGKSAPRLSAIVLGDYKSNADRIRVLAKDETTLVITLLQGDKELGTNEVRLYEKFKKDGRSLIVFNHSDNGQDGDNYGSIGVNGHRSQSGELYIASNGDVIYHESASGAGVAQISWVMIPYVARSSEAYTFKKLK
jgi:hypothetical protein